MAPASASPFAVLYLRPEIATGFYNFPPAGDSNQTPPVADTDDPSGDTSPTEPPPPTLFPGVPADEAAFFLPNGQIVTTVRRRLEHSGFSIVQERLVEFTKPQLRRLYFSGLHADDDEPTRTAFLDRFTRGPTLALLVALHEQEPDAAVTTLHALVGPEDPSLARKQALGAGLPVDAWPLRALCGLDAAFPGVYASATLDCAVRERHELFRHQPQDKSSPPPPLESAVIALLPPLLAAIPDAESQLIAAFNRHGLVVTTNCDRAALSADQIAAITAVELDPTATDAAGREIFKSLLEGFNAGGATRVLRVVGFHVDATLRQLIGPASCADAQRYFPESLRAQLVAPLVTLEDRGNGRTTCLETGVVVSQHLVLIQALAPEDETVTQTFAIIKPNAARDAAAVEAIQRAVLAFGFEIDAQRRLRLSPAQAAAFYAEHTGKPFFARLTAFMTSGEIVAMQLSRKLAIPVWRALMGPTNCLVARATHPWTLRARFGLDGTQNATHGSDAPASARRELRFFFGETSWNGPLERQAVATALVAQRATASAREPLEKTVVRGLEALLAAKRSGPLEACQWLGEWLLRQAEQPSTDADSAIGVATAAPPRGKASSATAVPRNATDEDDHATHRVVAIALDASVAVATRETLAQLVRDRVEPLGYAFVDVAGVDATAVDVAGVGRRRVVLFGWQDVAAATVRPTVVATVTTSNAAKAAMSSDGVPRATFEIPATLRDATPLHALFRGVLDPVVVAVVATEATSAWQRVAAHHGAAWLPFEALVAREIARERDPLGVFTQWRRTRAMLPPSLVLAALHHAIADPAALGLAPTAHAFVLVGFPWQTLDPHALDASVGRVASVVVGHETQHKAGNDDDGNRAWLGTFEARGAVVRCEDHASVAGALARVLAPHVTIVLGDGGAATAAAMDAVRHTATLLGDVWIDASAMATATVRRELLALAPSRRVVLSGFPRSPEPALALLRDVAVPRAVVVVGPVSRELEAVLAVLEREAPHAVQSAVTAAAPRPQLRSVMLASRVVVAVGDSAAIDATGLRHQLEAFGATLVDLRALSPLDRADTALDALSGVVAPRCLLLLAGAPPVALVRELEARLGDALAQLLVLKHRQPVPPRPPRRPTDDDDDAFDSDEERERDRVRASEAAALSPALMALADALPKPRARVESFLRVATAHTALVGALRPAVVGVRGHQLTFYREAVRAVCRALHVPFVDLRGATMEQQPVARLRAVVRGCASRVVVVDGFPVEHSDEPVPRAPYAAQQRRAIASVASTPLFVRFVASLDVLRDKLAPDASGRLAIEDAQDALASAAAQDVDGSFGAAAVRDVSCERELQDAQDAFTDVLRSLVEAVSS